MGPTKVEKWVGIIFTDIKYELTIQGKMSGSVTGGLEKWEKIVVEDVKTCYLYHCFS